MKLKEEKERKKKEEKERNKTEKKAARAKVKEDTNIGISKSIPFSQLAQNSLKELNSQVKSFMSTILRSRHLQSSPKSLESPCQMGA